MRSSTGWTPIPGPSGTRILPGPLQLDERVDEVLLVVAPARREVVGQLEVRERGDVEVVGPADAALEHAAAPDRDAVRLAVVVDLPHLDRPRRPGRP